MALQAAAEILGLASSAAAAAALCALALLLRALGARGAPPRRAAVPKGPGPLGGGAGAPLPEGQGQALRAAPARRWSGQDPGADVEAFLERVGRQCDLELRALCESAVDAQSAQVMRDLEDEFGGGLVEPAGPEPGLDFWASARPATSEALEGSCRHAVDAIDGALDCVGAAVLKGLEDGEYAGSCTLHDDAQGDCACEVGVLSRQAAGAQVAAGHAGSTGDTVAAASERHRAAGG
ncbi:unnamed protein product [Prorocentrum cordatum]|uniref:Uncharacterized protein n=1 Tax=Prorocentrum cordatum TaxID=2364126 RepID=A0ABN9RMJ9_9DINO|nr:unnamed protein product [Polarella glacialis]